MGTLAKSWTQHPAVGSTVRPAFDDRDAVTSAAVEANIALLRDQKAGFQRKARANRLQILDELLQADADARRAMMMVPEADAWELAGDFDWQLAGRLHEEVKSLGLQPKHW